MGWREPFRPGGSVSVNNIQKVAIAAVLASSFSVFASGQVAFKETDVKGTSPNSLTAINNAGQVVVNIATQGTYNVSLWDRFAGVHGLGLTGATNGADAINNSGAIVGAGDPNKTGVIQAFLWRLAEGTLWLGSLGGGLSAAGGMNDAGAVVGLSYTAADLQHAFLWTQSGGMQDLTPNLTSVGGATAMAINSSNQVVGYYFANGSGFPVGFSWTQASGLQDLGPTGTLALAVNNSGTVIGQSPNAQGYKHAFSWTQAGGMKDLGTLGGPESTALAINSKGWIVGTSLTNEGTGQLHGFLWTPSAGMKDLVVIAGLSKYAQPYSVEVNDYGVIAMTTNKGLTVLSPKMSAAVTSSVNPSKVGQPVTFTATVSSIAGAPPDGETVQFKSAGQVIGSGTLSNGVAQFTTSAIPVGSHVVAVTYVGDPNYLPNSYASMVQVVNP
jgi:probable HAF family extracellular repeat protein